MMNDETNAPKDKSEGRSLNDVLFVKLGLPTIVAGRTMRGALLDEVIAALIRAGILTKKDIERGLTEGQRLVGETCQDLGGKDPKSPDLDEAISEMTRTAEIVSQRIRNRFINEEAPKAD